MLLVKSHFLHRRYRDVAKKQLLASFACWKWAYTSSNSSGKERHGGTIWRCSSVRSHARIMIIRQLSIPKLHPSTYLKQFTTEQKYVIFTMVFWCTWVCLRGIASFLTSCKPGWLSFSHILKIARMISTHWPHQHFQLKDFSSPQKCIMFITHGRVMKPKICRPGLATLLYL